MRYVELHARTAFSFLDGASQPHELVGRAKALGLGGLAVTDVNGLYAVVEARDALLEACGLRGRAQEPALSPRLHYGSELRFDGDDVAVALAATREGYANLSQLLSLGRRAAEKGECRLTAEDVCRRSAEVVLLAGGPRSAAMRALVAGDEAKAAGRLSALREAFGDRLHVELVRHLSPGDHDRSLAMAALARRLGLPVVATNDVHFHVRDRKPMHDVMRCIRHGTSLLEASRRLLPNGEAHLKGPEEMARLFKDLPEAVERTGAVADGLTFRLCDVRYQPPAPDLPEGVDADTHLERRCRAGLAGRLGALAGSYVAKLEHELRIVRELGYAGYFLIMADVIEVCRTKGILCQGRGSAANSLVCFSLGITSVRPDVIEMLFERFLSKERGEPPDIDLDIEHERREEILQHVYAKYGRERAGMVAEVIRYRARSALREAGAAFGFSDAQLGRLTKVVGHGEGVDPRACAAAGIDPHNPMLGRLLAFAAGMEGFPRHLSIHTGGFILSDEPLTRSVPIENGRMADRTVIQWAKDDVDSQGMFKLDLLGLGMLTALAKTFALVKAHRGVALGLETVPPDDPATYEMLRRADTVGVFQVESRAQMNMLPRLKPQAFYDLVVQVAIVRPGPIQGDMVHPYLRRKAGDEAVDYAHPKLEPILRRTLGVPLFQEQVMQLAVAVGGYSAGEADQLRRDMASWKAEGRMQRHRERLLAGMRQTGLPAEFADRVYRQIEGFGSYGFPESHAAAFAHLAYVSSYLKCHYPAEFAAALVNSQPMGFYSPAVLVNDVRRHGIEIRRIDVQRSEWDCTLEDGALRLGLRLVRGLPEAQGRAIATARKHGAFSSMAELAARSGVPRRQLVALGAAGAMESLHGRREAMWAASALSPGPLFDGRTTAEPATPLPPLAPMEALALDVTYGGTFPGRHPLALLRERLARRGIVTAQEVRRLGPGRVVRVAGLVITRQMPGTKGILFLTLEDETGHADVAVMPDDYARLRILLRSASALIVTGRVVGKDARSLNLVSARPLPLAGAPAVRSHDFR